MFTATQVSLLFESLQEITDNQLSNARHGTPCLSWSATRSVARFTLQPDCFIVLSVVFPVVPRHTGEDGFAAKERERESLEIGLSQFPIDLCLRVERSLTCTQQTLRNKTLGSVFQRFNQL